MVLYGTVVQTCLNLNLLCLFSDWMSTTKNNSRFQHFSQCRQQNNTNVQVSTLNEKPITLSVLQTVCRYYNDVVQPLLHFKFVSLDQHSSDTLLSVSLHLVFVAASHRHLKRPCDHLGSLAVAVAE